MNQVKKRVKNFGNRNETSARRGNAMASVGGRGGGIFYFSASFGVKVLESPKLAKLEEIGGGAESGHCYLHPNMVSPQTVKLRNEISVSNSTP